MTQQEVEFKAEGYLTEFIVVDNTAIKIHNNRIEKEIKCSSHAEAEAARTKMVFEFWKGKLN